MGLPPVNSTLPLVWMKLNIIPAFTIMPSLMVKGLLWNSRPSAPAEPGAKVSVPSTSRPMFEPARSSDLTVSLVPDAMMTL